MDITKDQNLPTFLQKTFPKSVTRLSRKDQTRKRHTSTLSVHVQADTEGLPTSIPATTAAQGWHRGTKLLYRRVWQRCSASDLEITEVQNVNFFIYLYHDSILSSGYIIGVSYTIRSSFLFLSFLLNIYAIHIYFLLFIENKILRRNTNPFIHMTRSLSSGDPIIWIPLAKPARLHDFSLMHKAHIGLPLSKAAHDISTKILHKHFTRPA